MKRYSLDWCDHHLDNLLDKMGSDYFPLPVKLDRFITMTLDFVHKQTKDLEINQEASDQIKNILIRIDSQITRDTDSITNNVWNLPEPADYLRLIGIVPVIFDNVLQKKTIKAKVPATIKEGQAVVYNRDPFREATAEYPSVIRMGNFFKIDVGSDTTNYTSAILSYVKKPKFAEPNKMEDRIVNLSDIAIEKILNKTADSLRVMTSDPNSGNAYQFNQSFGMKNK